MFGANYAGFRRVSIQRAGAPHMPIYLRTPGNRAQAVMMPVARPITAPTQVQTILLPNTPQGLALAQGQGSDLTVTWSAPAFDDTHGSAAGYNLQYRAAGVG